MRVRDTESDTPTPLAENDQSIKSFGVVRVGRSNGFRVFGDAALQPAGIVRSWREPSGSQVTGLLDHRERGSEAVQAERSPAGAAAVPTTVRDIWLWEGLSRCGRR